jgi:hypothetical protein
MNASLPQTSSQARKEIIESPAPKVATSVQAQSKGQVSADETALGPFDAQVVAAILPMYLLWCLLLLFYLAHTVWRRANDRRKRRVSRRVKVKAFPDSRL